MKFKALDLFCGGGGASRGLADAGFTVEGIDQVFQPDYPFKFKKMDVFHLELDYFFHFDFIWASPPCQAYSKGGNENSRKKYPRLIEPTRSLLKLSRLPYCIENVVGAPLENPIMLCGEMFGLKVLRHRLFEISFPIEQPPHPKHKGTASNGDYYGVYNGGRCGCFGNNEKRKSLKVGTLKQWQAAMGLKISKYPLTQAIPPAYAEFIGKKAISYLEEKHNG